MSDSTLLGKYLVLGLGLASLTTWGWGLQHGLHRQTVLPWKPRTSPAWPGGLVLLAIVAAFLTPSYVLVLLPRPEAGSLQLLQIVCLGLLAQNVVLLAVLGSGGKLRREDLGLDTSTCRTDLRTGALAFLASLLPVFGVNLVVQLLGWRSEDGQHVLLKMAEESTNWQVLAWVALSAVVLAPIAEELMYRVVLQGYLETRLHSAVAIVVVAVLFAARHNEPGRPDALPLFPLALILGYVYYRRHSYIAVVLTHVLFNAANLLLVLVS